MGFKVIIDNCYPGLVYEDQVFRYLHTGNRVKGYINTVRPDGKIDVTLQPTGRQQTLDFSETLLQYLKDNGGTWEVSKKVFKRAVGELYKRRLIEVGNFGIKLK